MEKLYLKPGITIGRKGLPKGKLECKSDSEPLEIKEKLLKVIEDIVPFLKSEGKILDQAAYDKLMTVEDKSDSGKSDVRIALEKEATEFGIEFTDKTTQVVLKAEIEAKKSEAASNNEEIEELRSQAVELDIDFTDETSLEDLKLLIEDGLK